MTQQDLHPPRLDWRSLDEKDRLIWAAAFVAAERAGEDGAEVADAMVGKLRATDIHAEPVPVSEWGPNGEPPMQRVFDAFFRGIESRRGCNARNDRALQPVHEALAQSL